MASCAFLSFLVLVVSSLHCAMLGAVMPVLKLCCASGGKFSSNEFLVFSRCLQGLFDVFLYLFSTTSHFAIVCVSLRLFCTGAFLTNGLLFAQS